MTLSGTGISLVDVDGKPLLFTPSDPIAGSHGQLQALALEVPITPHLRYLDNDRNKRKRPNEYYAAS